MGDLISRKAVEKIIKEFFKTKVDEIPKREKFNKLCDLCDLYLELNADLHKEIEDIPVAYDVDKVVGQLEAKIQPNEDFLTGEPCDNWVVDMQNDLIIECISVVKGGCQG